MLAIDTLATAGMAPALALVPQRSAAAFGSRNTRPVCVAVSAKSIVTPASSRRLSSGTKNFMPRCSTTVSPGRGADSTLNSLARPEHPPGVTTRRKPLSAAPLIRSMRRMNFSAAAVMMTSMDRCSGSRLITRQALVDHAGVLDRTHRGALRLIEMPEAFGAFLRIDEEHAALFSDGNVRTFRFARGAAGALGCDDFQWHESFPPIAENENSVSRGDERALTDVGVAARLMSNLSALDLVEIILEPGDRRFLDEFARVLIDRIDAGRFQLRFRAAADLGDEHRLAVVDGPDDRGEAVFLAIAALTEEIHAPMADEFRAGGTQLDRNSTR